MFRWHYIVTGSNYEKCISLTNQKYQIQSNLINLQSNEYRQHFHYYLFTVRLNRCAGSFNTPNDLIKYILQIKQKI